MASPAFRENQWSHRYDPHIAPLNKLVDELGSTGPGWLPYIAPMYGGINARVLSLLRDPGPKTRPGTGSGFLSMENDDPTAEAISNHFRTVGISAADIVPWNAYPWYINRTPSAAELRLGLDPLNQVLQLLPKLRVVMLHGISARESWSGLRKRFPCLPRADLHVVTTYHPSRQAFRHKDAAVRNQRREHLQSAFIEAAQLLASVSAPAA